MGAPLRGGKNSEEKSEIGKRFSLDLATIMRDKKGTCTFVCDVNHPNYVLFCFYKVKMSGKVWNFVRVRVRVRLGGCSVPTKFSNRSLCVVTLSLRGRGR